MLSAASKPFDVPHFVQEQFRVMSLNVAFELLRLDDTIIEEMLRRNSLTSNQFYG